VSQVLIHFFKGSLSPFFEGPIYPFFVVYSQELAPVRTRVSLVLN